MKREAALEIATRFYNFCEGSQPENLTIKSMESANGKIVLRTTASDEDEDDDVTYEIEIDPTGNAITMKKVVVEFAVSDFTQKPKLLSELEEGDLFRLEADCAVWRFYRRMERCGGIAYGFTRKDDHEIEWLYDDVEVYPCGK